MLAALPVAILLGPTAWAQDVPAPSPEPAWQLGLGTRSSFAEAGRIDGLRAAALRTRATRAVGLDLFVAPDSQRISDLTRAILSIGDAQGFDLLIPEVQDVAALALTLEWSPLAWAPGERPAAGPRLFAGPEVRYVVVNAVQSDGETAEIASRSFRVQPGARAGVGFDVWPTERVGLRLGAMERIRYVHSVGGTRFGEWGTPWQFDAAVALDLVVTL